MGADAQVRDHDPPGGPRRRVVGKPATDRAVEPAPAGEVPQRRNGEELVGIVAREQVGGVRDSAPTDVE